MSDAAHPWRRYVATGDSFTEGLSDPAGDGDHWRGWADRLAESLARLAGPDAGFEYANLAIRALVARGTPLVAILWGRDAQTLGPLLGPTPAVESAHPSPMSADRGFFGSRPFSRVNAMLTELGAPPVDWRLD